MRALSEVEDFKLYTVIITYNGEAWIQACIASVLKSSFKSEILIVDNASTDTTIDLIEANFPEVMILKQPKNLGFGKANNIGISYALQKGAENVFLLNQDTYVAKNTIQNLIAVSKKNADFGILSPIQLNWSGTELEHYFAQFISKNKKLSADYFLNRTMDELYEVPFVNAAAWLIPLRTLKLIGGFDPMFLHYGEDNNYCQRLQYHQFKIGIVPNSFINHDSKIRKGKKIELFSNDYYKNEIKQWQLKLGDINDNWIDKEIHSLKTKMQKQVFRYLLQFNIGKIKGYLKKYRIFENEILRIKKSRQLNRSKGAHYLNL